MFAHRNDRRRRRVGPNSRGPGVERLFAFAVLLLVGGASGWLSREAIVKRQNDALRQQAYRDTLVQAHRLFSSVDGVDPTFPADRFEQFAASVDRRLGASIRLPPQADWSSSYRGGRLLPLRGVAAALLTFERPEGPITVVVLPGNVRSGPERLSDEVEGVSLAIVSHRERPIAIIGPLASSAIDKLVGSILR